MSAPATERSLHATARPAHDCPLCGYGFDEGLDKCGACPLHGGCATLCCPRCGYTFAEESATLNGLRKLGRSLRRLLRARRSDTRESQS